MGGSFDANFTPRIAMNLPATKKLIDTVRNKSAREDDIQQAAGDFFRAVGKVAKPEAEAQMALLAGHFDLPDPERGAFLARMCGALVEGGIDPLPMARPLRLRLQTLLEDCAKLADACRAQLPVTKTPNITREERDQFGGDDETDESDANDENRAFSDARAKLAAQLPRENAAWEALHTFWLPAIAVYSVCPEARYAAQSLRAPAQRIAEFHEGGHWIQLILSVLDYEPLLVIEPETRTGFLARSFGIVDNFQLNTLVMDTFPTNGGMRRVPLAVAETARGRGPQTGEQIVTAAWNLYAWQALRPNLQLPDAGSYDSNQHWIWNEGIPADIPLFENRRVILLGPKSYDRSWRSQRMFDKLAANLHIERQLSRDEATGWLQRMAAK
jgi:hypothetical protein